MRLECQGEFTVYVLMAKFSDGWKPFNMDCIPGHLPESQPFRASGACWQKTGIRGSFEEEEAFNLLQAVRKYFAFQAPKEDRGQWEFKIQKSIIRKENHLLTW